jgi:hypothetical protein
VEAKYVQAVRNKEIAQKQKKQLDENEEKIKRKAFSHKLSVMYNPLAALTFVAIYWAIGLKNAQFY